jgi:hypothetical protein
MVRIEMGKQGGLYYDTTILRSAKAVIPDYAKALWLPSSQLNYKLLTHDKILSWQSFHQK